MEVVGHCRRRRVDCDQPSRRYPCRRAWCRRRCSGLQRVGADVEVRGCRRGHASHRDVQIVLLGEVLRDELAEELLCVLGRGRVPEFAAKGRRSLYESVRDG